MALSCSSLCISKNPYFSLRLKVQLPQARSHNFPDEGKASNAVDANMSVLRNRMERVRMRERVSTSYKVEGYGWNYKSSRYDVVQKKHMFVLSSLLQLASIVCTTIGFVFLTGSLCIFLISFICSSSINSN